MPETSAPAIITKEQLERDRLDDDLFKILEDHLHGVGRGILRARLEDLCNHEQLGGKDAITLYNEAHISQKNAAKLISLLRVSQPFEEPGTLFGWVKTLSQKDYAHRHLEDFYHLLKQIKPRKSWTNQLLAASIGTALSGTYLYLFPEQMQTLEKVWANTIPIVSQFLQATFSVLQNIPLLLLLYNLICIPAQAYHSIFNDTFRSLPKRLQKWVTGTLPAVLSLISYGICYATEGVFTPTAVAFFIAASLVSVTHSLFNFYNLKPTGNKPSSNEPLAIQLEYARQKERRARTAQTIAVNLAASIFISICVIFWCVLPPSFLVMMGSILFINLVNFTKKAALNRIHTKGSETLQKELYKVSRGHDLATRDEASEDKLDQLLKKTEETTARLANIEKYQKESARAQFSLFNLEKSNEDNPTADLACFNLGF